ncbi:MAG TPA: class I SAM-dependent methyltransferase [Nitrosopumilaceae archaeon]|nr:class I SAM-dependent methyltransferase [Nitrosopumilaceae archaeon]
MKNNIIELIICPTCGNKLHIKLKKKIKNEIIEGQLICSKNHKFQIKKGIPRFVTDKEKDFVKTEFAFSTKWKLYHKLYQDKKWYDTQKKWFLERFGWKTISKFNNFLNTRHIILDAGTGIGNSAKFFSKNPKSQVFAIDASESIDFAYKKYGKTSNIHFLQADIRNLPFRIQTFDFICSDQVLHHTSNTETSFKYLTKLLKKNGIISIYVYKKKGPIREFVDDFIREQTVKMSERECKEFSKDMANLGKSLSKLNKKITIPRDIPILEIKSGTYDIQRFFYWNFLKCFWAEDGNLQRSIGVNFDWYFPKYAYRHTKNEIQSWCKSAKIKIIHYDEIESGISINGKKL